MSTETRARATIAGFATATALLALLAVAAGGCGGGSDTTTPPPDDNKGDPGTPTVTTGPYQPLTVGSTWTYHVDDQGVVYDKQSSVEAFEDMGGAIAGTMGFKVRETVKAAVQLTWYENGTRRSAPPRSARRRHRPPAVRRVVFAIPAARRRRPNTWCRARPGRSTTRIPRPPAASRPRRPTSPRPGTSTPSTSSPRCRRNVQRAQGHAHRHVRRLDQDAMGAPRRSARLRTGRRRPLRKLHRFAPIAP